MFEIMQNKYHLIMGCSINDSGKTLNLFLEVKLKGHFSKEVQNEKGYMSIASFIENTK